MHESGESDAKLRFSALLPAFLPVRKNRNSQHHQSWQELFDGKDKYKLFTQIHAAPWTFDFGVAEGKQAAIAASMTAKMGSDHTIKCVSVDELLSESGAGGGMGERKSSIFFSQYSTGLQPANASKVGSTPPPKSGRRVSMHPATLGGSGMHTEPVTQYGFANALLSTQQPPAPAPAGPPEASPMTVATELLSELDVRHSCARATSHEREDGMRCGCALCVDRSCTLDLPDMSRLLDSLHVTLHPRSTTAVLP